MVRDRAALRFVLLLDVRQLHPGCHRSGGDLAGLEGQLQLLGRLGRGPEPVRAVPASWCRSFSIRIACALTSARSRAVKLRNSSGSSGKVRV
jgi:hypothetical protein